MSCPDPGKVQTILDLPGLSLYLLFIHLGPDKPFLSMIFVMGWILQHI